jgi:hypothetical protein
MINIIKNKLICGSFAIFAVIAVVSALLSFKTNPGVTQEHFELLKPGMTQAEAERLLCGPPRNDLRYRALIWLPQATGKPISAEIAPEFPAVGSFVQEDLPKNGRQGALIAPAVDFFPQETSKGGHQGVWVARTRLIAVYFGRDGRLQYKYTSMVDECVPPSVVDWIASRPRMIRQSLGL